MVEDETPEGQDLAEIFDETNLTPDGGDIATSDELPDLLDVTSAIGDADDEDEGPDEDIDWDDVEPDQEDEDGNDPPLRTRLEDEPETQDGALDEGAIDGVNRPSPYDVDGGARTLDAERVSTEDRWGEEDGGD